MILEGKGSFLILLFIVAFLSLTLAALAGYVLFVAGAPKASTTETAKSETVKKPDESELDIFPIFESKKIFNLKSTDDKKLSVISISAEIEYFKGKKPEETKKKLEKYKGKMQEIIGDYFLDMTLEESQRSETKRKTKEVIKAKLNDLLRDEKDKKDIVYDVIFPEWISQ